MLIYLIIRYPQVAIPALALFILWRVLAARNKPSQTIASHNGSEAEQRNVRGVEALLDQYRQSDDPNFSKTLLLDFAQQLFYQYHHSRSTQKMGSMRPYFKDFDQITQQQLPLEGLQVTEVVVGSVNFKALVQQNEWDWIRLDFDANYTETIQGHTNRYWVLEQWTLCRKRGTLSMGPDEMQELGCPNCGASFDPGLQGECKQCNSIPVPGTKNWAIYSINQLSRQAQKGLSVGQYAEEKGTNLPTIFDPRLNAIGREFIARHQIESIAKYAGEFKEIVVEPVFKSVYKSWTERNYLPARPLMTDNLFRSHAFWIDQYKKHRLINQLEDLNVKSVQLVKLDLDKYFEAATVRIFATVRDYTTDENGNYYAGDKQVARHFSEYWTFVRRQGSHKALSEYKPEACPNCGAGIKMGMTGVCEYCNTKVTTGEFGWILSRITQDEAYRG